MNKISILHMENYKDLALHSQKLFARGEYEEAQKILKFLLQKYPHDQKIKHNLAVLEYYASNLTKTDQFINNIKTEIHTHDWNKIDKKHAFYYYNYALVLFYMKQYHQALIIIESLLEHLFTLNVNIILQILLLAVDLNLKIYKPYYAIEMIKFIEYIFNFNKDNKKLDCTYVNKLAFENTYQKNFLSFIPDKYVPLYKNLLYQYKLKCFIQMKDVKNFKKESQLNKDLAVIPFDTYIISEFDCLTYDSKKSISELTEAHNLKLFQKLGDDPIEKCLMNNSVYSEYLTTCYYNNLASIHLSMNKPNLSVFYSRKALTENENLLGEFPDLDHTENTSNYNSSFNSQQPNNECVAKVYNCGKNILVFEYDKRHELLYNLGIHLLHAKKPLPAFDCLIEILQIYYTNPRIWLRIAECCILAIKGGNEENFSLKRKLQSAVQHIMGYGIHRKTILIPNYNHKIDTCSSPSIPSANLEFATICLKNALILIDEMLFNDTSIATSGNQMYAMAPSNPITKEELYSLKSSVLACATYIQLCLDEYYLANEYGFELVNLLNLVGGSVIMNYMANLYVAECLIFKDNVRNALQYLDFQDGIYGIPYLKKSFDKIAVFATHAPLPNTSTINETVENDENRENSSFKWNLIPISKIGSDVGLSPRFFKHLAPLTSKNTSNFKIAFNWTPQDLPSAKLIMHYNLCVCYTLLGEYEKASHMLRNNIPFKTPNDLPSQFIALALYLAIKQGHLDIARMIILQNFSQIQH